MRGLVRFAEDTLGLSLYPGQVEVLESWGASGCRKALFCLGRRSGKGLMAVIAAIYNATVPDYTGRLLLGSTRFILVVANRDKQAQEFIRMVREVLEGPDVDPDLLALVDFESCTLEQIVFRNNVVIRAVPCSSRSTRGLAVSLVILDESGHFQTDSEGVGAGKEVYNALAPSIAQFQELGYILFTSTPKWRSGLFWEQYKNGTEGIDPGLFVVKRATWEMNPKITRESLEPDFRVDPDYASTEYGADFSSAEGAFLDILDILAAKRDTGILPPADHRYKCAIDPAFQKDAFAMAIAHKEKDLVVIDGVWVWHRHGYDQTLDEVAGVARRYGVRRVRTDQFSSQSVLEGLQKRRIECEVIPWANENKFEAFTRLKAALATRQVNFPNDDLIVQELMNLEAKPTVTGLVRIAASAGNHDDRATVIAALMDMLESDYGPIVLSWRDYRVPATDDPFVAMGEWLPD